ncbi:MAG TPA: ABC transporter ATP-binding protein [Caulobacteraceae bacterium]|nr:ABC transporter ATP-binding protein [Caulobacteraceae bacterium]
MSAQTTPFAYTRRLLRLAAMPRWALPSIVTLGLIAAALEGVGLYLLVPLVQSLSSSTSQHQLIEVSERVLGGIPPQERTLIIIAGVCVAIVLKNVASLLNTYLTRYVYGHVAHNLRIRLFRQVLASCIDYRPGNRMTDIIETVGGNTWKVGNAVTMVFRVIVSVCTFVVFLALMLFISVRLTALALVLMAVGAFLVHAATRRAQEVGAAAVEENKRFGLRMWESIGFLQLIRTHSREDYEVERLGAASHTVRRRLLQMDLLWALPGPLSEVSAILIVGTIIVVGTTIGAGVAVLAAFLVVLYRLQTPAREMMQVRVMLNSLGAAVDDVETMLEQTAQPLLTSGDKPAPTLREGIAFENVSFAYAPGETPALRDVSLVIEAGQVTALVGASGAGKSTLMRLLFRFQDPTEGRILADGQPLTEIGLAGWRSRIGLLSQEPHLFNASVEANIGYSVPGATPEQVRAAADIAGATSFIEALPEGFQTVMGDRGARLSGGQKQRIALARTILSDPDILLLDEPTNALDNESERAFQTALEVYAKNRTVIVIAHKLSTVREADKVIVLDAGRVVEVGPPDALLARPGHFARLHGLEQTTARRA